MQISSWVLGNVAGGILCSPFRGAPSIPPSVTRSRQNLLLGSCGTRLPCDVGSASIAAAKRRRRRATTTLALQQQQHRPRTPDSDPTAAVKGNSQPTSQSSPQAGGAATEGDDHDGADRMFAAARDLHLRRHRSVASRGNALRLFRETMRLRPEWKETDSRFAVESGIDDVLKAFSHPRDFLGKDISGGSGANSSSSSKNSSAMGNASSSTSGTGGEAVMGSHGVYTGSVDGTSRDDVICLREHLDAWGYTARTVQERFGVGAPNRLPGPYYLRKSLDHKHASMVSAMGQPKDPLDVAIRLFLLGLAVPRAQAEQTLGRNFLESASRLGMLGECPVDPLLVVSLVQLFPLDAEALLPPTSTVVQVGGEATVRAGEGADGPPAATAKRPTWTSANAAAATVRKAAAAVGEGADAAATEPSVASSVVAPLSLPVGSGGGRGGGGKHGRGSADVGGGDGVETALRAHHALSERGIEISNGCNCGGRGGSDSGQDGGTRSRWGVHIETPVQKSTGGGGVVVAKGAGGVQQPKLKDGRDEHDGEEEADCSSPGGSCAVGRVVAASDMLFATDWPPPGSTALTEDPVMYIGPDSIGLVQHAPCGRAPARAPASAAPLPESRDHNHYHAGHRHSADEEQETQRGSGGRAVPLGHGNTAAVLEVLPLAAAEEAARAAASESAGLHTAVEAKHPAEVGESRQDTALEMPLEEAGQVGKEGLKKERHEKRGGKEGVKEGPGSADGTNGARKQRQGVEEILDLCCGSGVQGIAAAVLRRGEASVTCVDISPRAVRFARFNALLNGLKLDAGATSKDGLEEEEEGEEQGCFRAIVGDLYGALLPPADEGHAVIAAPYGARDANPSGKGDRCGVGGGGATFSDVRPPALDARSTSLLPSPSPSSSLSAAAAPAAAGATSTATTATPTTPKPRPHLSPASTSGLSYDLILANPPFVPVPPRLDAVRRRYDLFASGGASGEEVIEGILRGAVDHLRPGGGVLAVVTELANPRTFDAKLRRWAGGAAAPEGGWVEERVDGDDDGSRIETDSGGGGGGGGGASVPAWTGAVLHERQPWTAREYAARRAGSLGEVEGWERHLRKVVGIQEMSAGFVFVRRGLDGAGGGGGGGAKVEVRGVEKLWAPHNRKAIEHTKIVLDEL